MSVVLLYGDSHVMTKHSYGLELREHLASLGDRLVKAHLTTDCYLIEV